MQHRPARGCTAPAVAWAASWCSCGAGAAGTAPGRLVCARGAPASVLQADRFEAAVCKALKALCQVFPHISDIVSQPDSTEKPADDVPNSPVS